MSSSSTGHTSVDSSIDGSHDVRATTIPSEPVGFRVSGFTAVNSAPNTPTKKINIKDSMSPSGTSSSKTSDRLGEEAQNDSKQRLLADGIEALDMDWALSGNVETTVNESSKNKDSASRFGKAARSAVDAVGATASTLGKRARGALKPLKKQLAGAEKERRKSNRILDLDEKMIEDNNAEEEALPPPKKPRVSKGSADAANAPHVRPKGDQLGNKQWESTGVYYGARLEQAATKKSQLHVTGNKTLPGPIFIGARMYETGREFSLPFDVYSPLQTRPPKPEEWRKTKTSKCEKLFARHANI